MSFVAAVFHRQNAISDLWEDDPHHLSFIINVWMFSTYRIVFGRKGYAFCKLFEDKGLGGSVASFGPVKNPLMTP
jgi:hypothetical protein